MIIISFLGLDPYISEHVSKTVHHKIASLLACPSDNVIIWAPESYLFHNGVDQTSWHTIIQIHGPSKIKNDKEKISKYLHQTLKEHIVHLTIQFYFIDESDQYEFIDKDHPKFVTSANEVVIEDSNEEEVYQGDVFASLMENDE